MTPGTQPQSVSRSTMSIDPQPRSITASGGKIMARMTWRQDITLLFMLAKIQKMYQGLRILLYMLSILQL